MNQYKVVEHMKYVKSEGLYIDGHGPYLTKSGVSTSDVSKGTGWIEVTVTLLVTNLELESSMKPFSEDTEEHMDIPPFRSEQEKEKFRQGFIDKKPTPEPTVPEGWLDTSETQGLGWRWNLVCFLTALVIFAAIYGMLAR